MSTRKRITPRAVSSTLWIRCCRQLWKLFSEDRVWREEGVAYSQVYEYDSTKTAVFEEIQLYFESLYEYLREHPEFFAPNEDK